MHHLSCQRDMLAIIVQLILDASSYDLVKGLTLAAMTCS